MGPVSVPLDLLRRARGQHQGRPRVLPTLSVEDSVRQAKVYLQGSLAASEDLEVGKGHGRYIISTDFDGQANKPEFTSSGGASVNRSESWSEPVVSVGSIC